MYLKNILCFILFIDKNGFKTKLNQIQCYLCSIYKSNNLIYSKFFLTNKKK